MDTHLNAIVNSWIRWLQDAIDSKSEVEPNAMTLATCTP